MGFDGSSAAGLKKLNGYLSTRSYIEGYTMSAADTAAFATCSGVPSAKDTPHAFRWYKHIAAKTGSIFVAPAAPAPAPAVKKDAPAKKAAPAKKQDDDDDFDNMFDDDDDDEEEADTPSVAERAKAAKAKHDAKLAEAKSKAEARLAQKEKNQRSLCALEVKPWEADQDLLVLHKKICDGFQMEGLKWGEKCELKEVAFGIKKIIMTAVISMSISMDAIIEEIVEDKFADEVQSMSMISMSLL